jgi:malate synthase
MLIIGHFFYRTLRNKSYTLNKEVAVLIVRPRGLHLEGIHLLINNEITSGSLIDFEYMFSISNIVENGLLLILPT